jgi:hypothetical protein
MTRDTTPPSVTIRRIRITGLAGPAPTREAVRVALAQALAAPPETVAAAGGSGRSLPAGSTLVDAAKAAAGKVREAGR